MSEIREIELKYALEGEEDYQRLCENMGTPEDEWDQINHYFHSKDSRIPGTRGVIRIRVEKGRALFTVKLGGMLSEAILSSHEYEVPFPANDDSYQVRPEVLWDMGNKGMKILEDEHGKRVPLVWAGQMINHRKVFPLDRELKLEVDASQFPDGFKDLEVELETHHPESDRPRLVGLLKSLNIRFHPQTKTKYQRFLEHCKP
jgi:uncharacterized protein YjbK